MNKIALKKFVIDIWIVATNTLIDMENIQRVLEIFE